MRQRTNGKKIFENNKYLQRMKGHTNNPNGRPKGTPNKVTSDLKQWVNEILTEGRGKFMENLGKLPPDEYVKAFTALLNYVLPKQQAMSVDAQISAEYKAMQELMNTAPDDVVEKLAVRVIELQEREKE